MPTKRPIRVHAAALYDTGHALTGYFLMIGEERLRNCVDFNEAEGWADVYESDDAGNLRLSDGTPCLRRVYGDVQLIAPPDLRAWFEEHFAVTAIGDAP